MEKLHYKTLEAAVKTYGPLKDKTEEEVKAAIAADEKKFTPEQVEEIYNAIVSPKADEPGKYIVVNPFRDKDNFLKRYDVGDDVSHFDKKRLATLESLGLIEKRSLK